MTGFSFHGLNQQRLLVTDNPTIIFDHTFCGFSSGLESVVFLEVLNQLHPKLKNDGFLPYVQFFFHQFTD